MATQMARSWPRSQRFPYVHSPSLPESAKTFALPSPARQKKLPTDSQCIPDRLLENDLGGVQDRIGIDADQVARRFHRDDSASHGHRVRHASRNHDGPDLPGRQLHVEALRLNDAFEDMGNVDLAEHPAAGSAFLSQER